MWILAIGSFRSCNDFLVQIAVKMCWAGCTDVQLAHETDGEGGRFTKVRSFSDQVARLRESPRNVHIEFGFDDLIICHQAFTDYITKHSLEGARTYQFLNRYVQ